MHFAQSYMFNLLFLVIAFTAMIVWLARFRRKRLKRFLEEQLLPDMAASFSRKMYVRKNMLLVLALIFSVFALARPQWGFEWQQVKRKGLDILLVIDTSKSMLTEDVKPNRLERTKLAVKDLLQKLKGDRVGLIAFSGSAFLVCPLTADYSGFLLSLNNLGVDTIPRGGTDLGAAIEEALKGYQDVPSQYKAIVLLTDGENWEDDPLHWAKVAAEKKIRIYTIGIGTKEGDLIRVPNDKGEAVFLKDSEGNYVKSRLNEQLLKEIAATTGGAYVRAGGAVFGLGYLYDNELSKLEKREFESQIEKKYFDRFQIPLALAFFLLLADTLLAAKKPE